MFITNIFKLTRTCHHEHVTPDKDCVYCPDCGKLIKNEWYITRCATCGVKLKTTVRNGEIQPIYNFCANCGNSNFIIEKLDNINFIDINFAVLKKTVVEENSICSSTQCWEEKRTKPLQLSVKY